MSNKNLKNPLLLLMVLRPIRFVANASSKPSKLAFAAALPPNRLTATTTEAKNRENRLRP
jgi:hypothetical protein